MITTIFFLPNSVKDSIKNFINEKGLEKNFPIRDNIFTILENYCTVVYYPQEKEDNDGCHITKFVNNKLQDFVYINTYKSIEKQIFTAAHELGHILKLDKALENISDYNTDMKEQAMNAFAAMLLMPQSLFNNKTSECIKKYADTENNFYIDDFMKCCIYLMDFFFVPFKSIIIRLCENGFLDKNTSEQLLQDNDIISSVNSYITVLGYKRLGIRSMKKNINELPEMLDKLEKNEIFNENKNNAIREKMEIPIINSSKTKIKLETKQ